MSLLASSLGPLLRIAVPPAAIEHAIERRERERLSADERFVDVGTSRIRYRLTGSERDASPVVLLSGFSAPLEQWGLVQSQVEAFAPVLTYDRGGTGLSSGSRAHDAREQAEELGRLLDALHPDKPVVVVGYSNSALIARVFADRYPERVAGLVFVDPSFPEQMAAAAGWWWHFAIYVRYPLSFWSRNAVGLRRAQRFLGLQAPVRPAGDKQSDIELLTSHWWATLLEGICHRRSARQAFGFDGRNMVVGIVAVRGSKGSEGDELLREIANRSPRLERISLESVDHLQLITQPEHARSVTGLIRAVTERLARERGYGRATREDAGARMR